MLKTAFESHRLVVILLPSLINDAMILSGISFMSPETGELLNWGANLRTLILQGEWWRLFTACFLHIGIFHILLNMWALYNIGFFLERMIGTWRFTFAYIIAGLAGSLNSIVWHPATTSAGASGAIFGMFGLFLALLTTNILEKGFRTSMLRSILPMILFNLLIGTSAQIDNAGHIGGLFAGLSCGYLYAWFYKNPKNQWINRISFILPSILILVFGFVISQKLSDPYGEYDKMIKDLARLEEKAIFSLNNSRSSEDFDQTSKLWDEAIQLLNRADSIELREEITDHNERLMFYLEKRKIESILYKDKTLNQDKIIQNKASIDSILKVIENPNPRD